MEAELLDFKGDSTHYDCEALRMVVHVRGPVKLERVKREERERLLSAGPVIINRSTTGYHIRIEESGVNQMGSAR